MGQVVLVTGVSRYLGGRMAKLLTDDPNIDRVIGVDVVPPRADIGRAEFVRADIRNPIISKVINAADVDTVVHMGVIATPVQAGGRVAMKEINVIGTMQLLAACQKAPSIQRLVVKSTSSVYGAGPRDPAMFSEDVEPRHSPSTGWAKDSAEVEAYVRGFARRRPDVTVTTLRFANFIGPQVQTPMTSYFSLPLVPVVAGYDARLQFIHEDDGLDVLYRTTIADYPGLFNVAGEGIIALSQAIRLAGRVALPLLPPVVGVAGRAMISAGLADFSPEQVRFLTYGRGIDTTRMVEELGFRPEYSTREAFESFVEARDLNRVLSPDRVEAAEETLGSLLTRGGSRA
ncbi:MAG: NAD-dependent epimerase/dehydratase family protein [Actinobacteria bacterium]|nr:NAD-dependent epimerase/dehydratase family protein [Actinomycetota bacterium]